LTDNNNSDKLPYAKNALEAILKQWGRAYVFMSHQRRRASVSLVQPDIEHLLSDKGSFDKGKEARDFLFTNLFVDKMYRSAKVNKTVHEAIAASTAASKAAFPKKKFSGRFRDRDSEDSSYRGQSYGGASRPLGRGRGRGRSRGRPGRGVVAAWTSGTRRYLSDFSTKVNCFPQPKQFIIAKPEPIFEPLRANIPPQSPVCLVLEEESGFFANNWKIVTSDQWMLQTVSQVCLSILFLHSSKFPSLVRSLWMIRWLQCATRNLPICKPKVLYF